MRWIALLFVPLLAAVQCGRTDLDAGVRLTPVAMVDGESNGYRVVVNNDEVGSYQTVLRHVLFKDVPAYELTIVTKTLTGDVATTDSSILYFGRDSLAPLSSFRFIRTGQSLHTAAANYGQGSVAVSSWRAGEEEQKLLPFGARTFDSDQLTFLGRVIYLEPKKPQEVGVIMPLTTTVRAATFEIQEDETVTVPAGTFDCRKLKLTMDTNVVTLWYEKAGTRRLIRYEAEASGVAMELLPTVPE